MRRTSLAVLLAVVVQTSPGADRPAGQEGLLRMVPADVGACLILRDLAGHWDRLRQSALWVDLQQTAVYQAWRASPGYARFQEQKARLEAAFGPLADVLKNLVGQQVVLAFRPDPGGDPSQGQGLLLSQTRDADATARLIQTLHRIERSEMKLVRLTVRQHKGHTYHEKVVVQKGKESAQYYAQLDTALVVSNQKQMLLDALALRGTRGQGSLARSAVVAETLAPLGPSAMATLFVNPRRFDAQMALADKQVLASGNPGRRFVHAMLRRNWEALKGFGATLSFDGGIVLRLYSSLEPGKMSATDARIMAAGRVVPKLWPYLPPQPLVVVTGSGDFAASLEVLERSLGPRGRRGLVTAKALLGGFMGTTDVQRDVLSRLGPGFALWAECDPTPDAEQAFPQVTLAFRVREPATRPTTQPTDTLRKRMTTALETAMRMVVLPHNLRDPKHPIVPKQMKLGKGVLHYVDGRGKWGRGLVPGFAFCGSYLLLGTHKDTIVRFHHRMAGGRPGPASDPLPLAAARRAGCAGAQHVTFVDVPQVRSVLRAHRQWLIDQAVAKKGKSPEEAAADLDRLDEILAWSGEFCWATRVQRDGVYRVIRLVVRSPATGADKAKRGSGATGRAPVRP